MHPYTGTMNNNSRRSRMKGSLGTILLLLLLCATCVVPVMASTMATSGSRVVEDGVHLVKFTDSPTELDDQYYHMKLPETIVIDGNQFYWVRIGNVVSARLTTVWWALIASVMLFGVFCGFFAWYWSQGIPHIFPNALPKNITDTHSRLKVRMIYSIPLICIGLLSGALLSSGVLPHAITHAICGDYMDIQASDGTILIQVDKIHPESNTVYMKTGINLTKLTHLSSSGNILNLTGVKPI